MGNFYHHIVHLVVGLSLLGSSASIQAIENTEDWKEISIQQAVDQVTNRSKSSCHLNFFDILFGSHGRRGPNGRRGPRGPRGHHGHNGKRGPTGPTGPTGPIGPIGPIGPGFGVDPDNNLIFNPVMRIAPSVLTTENIVIKVTHFVADPLGNVVFDTSMPLTIIPAGTAAGTFTTIPAAAVAVGPPLLYGTYLDGVQILVTTLSGTHPELEFRIEDFVLPSRNVGTVGNGVNFPVMVLTLSADNQLYEYSSPFVYSSPTQGSIPSALTP